MAGAAINQTFRQLLLSDPAAAIAQGYYGETFDVDPEDEQLLISIRVSTLPEFARQMLDKGKEMGKGNGYSDDPRRPTRSISSLE